jgi:PIN domain nuclease of toxin-antitoxin system
VTPLLLDTHAYLWFVFDDPRLSERAAAAIADRGTELLLSIASLWEMTIKRQLGKLDLGMALSTFLQRYVEQRRVTVLAVELPHLIAYDQLPLVHRDPFDRLLVAQAKVLGTPIVTIDPNFRSYDVEVVW